MKTDTLDYDLFRKSTRVTDPLDHRTEYQYDANGNRVCLIDANAQQGDQPKNADGCTLSTQYDELNRPILVKDALNGITQTAYDLAGHRLSVIDAQNKTWRFAYDDLGRLISETDRSAGDRPSEAGDHRMDRCWLQGAVGDALHVVLCAAGYNLRWLLRAMLRLGLRALFFALDFWRGARAVATAMTRNPLSTPKSEQFRSCASQDRPILPQVGSLGKC